MKYIRTKKEILYLIGEPQYADDGVCEQSEYECITSKGKVRYVFESEIVKQADTIDELCDEFVIKGTRGRYLGIPLQECELRNIPITQIYGAIWTDKGLIYVAKMNEKGELELL